MTDKHPLRDHGITALYAAYDPDFQGVSFMTIPGEENGNFVSWIYTADWGGSEEVPGTIFAGGMVAVSKHFPIALLYTTFPTISYSLLILEDE